MDGTIDGIRIQSLISPIVRAACFRSRLSTDEEDVRQEVLTLLIPRLRRRGLTEKSEHYIRRTARLDSTKVCRRMSRVRALEVATDFEAPEHQRLHQKVLWRA